MHAIAPVDLSAPLISGLIHDDEPMGPRDSDTEGDLVMPNTSAIRATPLRPSTRVPGTSRRGRAFDVGAPIAYGPDNIGPEPCVAHSSAAAKDKEESGSAVDTGAASEQEFCQVDPQLQAEATVSSLPSRSAPNWTPSVTSIPNTSWKTMDKGVREYKEHVEWAPLEPFTPTPCDDRVRQTSMEVAGGGERWLHHQHS